LRWFFRRRIPELRRVLLVESGSRHLSAGFLRLVRKHWGDHIMVDLVTCYAGLPEDFPPELEHHSETAGTRVFRISAYPGRAGRKRLYDELRTLGYDTLGIICSGEPIMTRWKWAIAASVPAKTFVLNENGDFFWVDYSQRRIIAKFVLLRAGLAGPGAVRNVAALLVFPFTLVFLLAYAASAHLGRRLRLLVRHPVVADRRLP
jgi:hypothetical protein